MQQDYLNERLRRSDAEVYKKAGPRPSGDQDNLLLDRYQSVHADKFRTGAQADKGRGDEDFTLLARPVGEDERQAYKDADYQTRVRVERANYRKASQVIEPGAVDSSHRQSTVGERRGERGRGS